MSERGPSAFAIRLARSGEMDLVRELFREYADWLQVDLCFQDFEQELAGLPGAYAPPAGAIWLAEAKSGIAGCVAVRPVEEGRCEMKRLWVRAPFRGQSLGRKLAETAIGFGREAGYRCLCLDTLGQMAAARQLYKSLGFREIPAYYDNPLEDVRYLELDL